MMQNLATLERPDIVAALRNAAATKKLAAMGAVNYDEIFLLPGTMRDDGASHVSTKQLLAGGHAANCATALARLGCAPAVMGAVGRDSYGHWLIKDLNANGIDASDVVQIDAPTGRAIIPVFEDSHFMILERGANEFFELADPARIEGFDGLAVFDPGLPALQNLVCHLDGATGTPDIYWTPGGHYAAHPIVADLFPYLRAVFLNTAEAEDFHRAHPGLRASYPDICVVETQGAAGATCSAGTLRAHAPGFLTDCIDPTGAGDSFAACFILADQAGLEWPLCLKLANLGGMIAVETVGARPKGLSLDRLEVEINSRELAR